MNLVAHALTACRTASGRMDPNGETFVTHSLSSEGADASEDGTGRGTPLAVVPIDMRQASRGATMTNNRGDDVASGGAPGTGIGEGEAGGPRPSLAETHTSAAAVPLAFDWTQGGQASETIPTRSVGTGLGIPSGPAVAFQERGRAGGPSLETQEDLAYSMNAPAGGGRRQEMNVAMAMSVRRLTPAECCRLQAFPDDWLDLDPPLSDSAKYRLLGNAVTVSVARWLAERIEKVCPKLTTYGELFAGIGGFGKGFSDAGLKGAWAVEIDPDCRKVLKRHWPELVLHDDVRTFARD